MNTNIEHSTSNVQRRSFNKAIRQSRNKAIQFTADLSAYELIGSGAVRSCYREPGGETCVKFYTCQDKLHPKRKQSTRWRLRLTRHIYWLNINMQEWRYYERLKKRLPPALMAAFPERMEPLYSSQYGWGLRETLLLNADGTNTRLVEVEIKRMKGSAEARELYQRVSDFLEQMICHAVAVYDPRNILVQWTSPVHYVLRMVDFEPEAKAIIPGLTYLKWFVRHRVTTRSRRYLQRLNTMIESAKKGLKNEKGC